MLYFHRLFCLYNFTKYALGSVLVEFGDTKVICTASIEDKVPPFLRNTGTGWINAEYSMLPRSTQQRKVRDSSKGKIDGRTQEIQRLIGRSLRACVDLEKMPKNKKANKEIISDLKDNLFVDDICYFFHTFILPFCILIYKKRQILFCLFFRIFFLGIIFNFC